MKVPRFFARLWLKLRVAWSNYINRKDIVDIDVPEKFSFVNVPFDLRQIGLVIDHKFNYKYDSPLHFFDDMHYPAQCYMDAMIGGLLEDDCDGFHAACYHIAQKYMPCYLLTYITGNLVSSHTVLVCIKDGRWYLLDYTTVYAGDKLEQVLNNLIASRRSSPIVSWNMVVFDYNKEKYIVI